MIRPFDFFILDIEIQKINAKKEYSRKCKVCINLFYIFQ